jgi:hypothetical protein
LARNKMHSNNEWGTKKRLWKEIGWSTQKTKNSDRNSLPYVEGVNIVIVYFLMSIHCFHKLLNVFNIIYQLYIENEYCVVWTASNKYI